MEIEIEKRSDGLWEINYQGGLMETGTLKECAMWLVKNSSEIETGTL
jgi:hypothetical protein